MAKEAIRVVLVESGSDQEEPGMIMYMRVKLATGNGP